MDLVKMTSAAWALQYFVGALFWACFILYFSIVFQNYNNHPNKNKTDMYNCFSSAFYIDTLYTGLLIASLVFVTLLIPGVVGATTTKTD